MTKHNEQFSTMLVQKHQLDQSENKICELDVVLNSLRQSQEYNSATLDQAMGELDSLLEVLGIDAGDASYVDVSIELDELAESIEKTKHHSEIAEVSTLDILTYSENMSWKEYQCSVERYASINNIDLRKDPYTELMLPVQRIELEKRIEEEFTIKNANCDKYDYLIAGTCGLIGGLIDVVFVGVPGNSALGEVAGRYADNATEKFASLMGFNSEDVKNNYKKYVEKQVSKGKEALDLKSYVAQRRIQFLEGKFKVNYDQTSTNGRNGTGGKVDNLSASNHHLKSLGHSPDIIGLFFSILNQFTSTSSFISNGRLITIDTEKFELHGENFVAKVFCGFVNWFGHIMSDLAGSNSSVAKGNRGMGVPIPFYSLLQLVEFGEFGKHKQTFAKIAVQVFEQGYDFRHGMAMAIPVLVTELLTRITWVVKQHFYHNKPWSECNPSISSPELRRMLLVAHGALCLVDTADAALRSGGDMIQFMLRSNLIAWVRFGTLALKELAVWYRDGNIDVESVDCYLEAEYKRLLSDSP